jgi:hypothetical protein
LQPIGFEVDELKFTFNFKSWLFITCKLDVDKVVSDDLLVFDLVTGGSTT